MTADESDARSQRNPHLQAWLRQRSNDGGLLQNLRTAFKSDRFVNHYSRFDVHSSTIHDVAVHKPGCSGLN